MAQNSWLDLLTRLNTLLMNDPEISDGVPEEARTSRWMGHPAATDAQLTHCERQLSVALPPAYRSFLRNSNGWYRVNRVLGQLWSSEEVVWFAARHQDWIDALTVHSESVSDVLYDTYGDEQQAWAYRPAYLQDALEVSEERDGAILLLNPRVVTPEGEWEAIFLADWFPGAQRYRSFLDLMQGQYEEYHQLRATELSE